MNRGQYHFIIIFAIIVLFGSCRNSDLYDQNIKIIDSLSTVVNILQEEFLKTDTVLLKNQLPVLMIINSLSNKLLLIQSVNKKQIIYNVFIIVELV